MADPHVPTVSFASAEAPTLVPVYIPGVTTVALARLSFGGGETMVRLFGSVVTVGVRAVPLTVALSYVASTALPAIAVADASKTRMK